MLRADAVLANVLDAYAAGVATMTAVRRHTGVPICTLDDRIVGESRALLSVITG